MITYSYRKIADISWPLILGMVIQTLIGTTDTIFLGHVGEVELGASAIGGLFYLLVYMIEHGFATGGQILMARRFGRKGRNLKKIGNIFWLTNNVISGLSIAAIIAIYFTAYNILRLTIAQEVLQSAILIYCIPRSFGLIFSGVKSVMSGFLVAINTTRHIAIASVILLVANIGFDWWLIFGGWGIEPMGLKGAAIASVLAEAGATIYLAGYIAWRINWRKYGFDKFLLWHRELFREIMLMSSYIMLLSFLGWGTWLYFFIEIEKLGVEALAISNILKSMLSFLCIVASSLATVTTSIVSTLIGAGKNAEVLPTLKRIFKFGALPYYGGFLILAIWPEQFLGLFTDDAALIERAVGPLYTMLAANLIILPESIYFYALFGAGRLKFALITEVICSVIYIAAIRIIIGVCRADLEWCYLVDLVYYATALPIAYFYMQHGYWQDGFNCKKAATA
ncbi:MAG: MATE family efflux transporter [Alphaproteobacteria bacterium]|nr:MATE family efflux transporter [Alphaproteobacteria bacterium]